MTRDVKELYETYAMDRPYFDGEALPPGLEEIVRSGSGTFLEVGAGDGGKLRMLDELGAFGGYDAIVASDISEVRAGRIRDKIVRASVIAADATALPVADASVDFYLSDQVIEHVADDAAMVREIARVVKPGGMAYVGSVVKGTRAWYFYRNGGEWRLDPTHVREYASVEAFVTTLSNAELHVLSCRQVPVAFSLVDLVIRAAIKARVLSEASIGNVYRRLPLLRRIRGVKLAIPGYSCVYATIRRDPIRPLPSALANENQ